MTDKELIERLRSGLHELERTVLGGVPHDARSLAAADRIEALTAENKRLREALGAKVTTSDMDDDTVQCVMCEKHVDIEHTEYAGDCWVCKDCYASWRSEFDKCEHDWEAGLNEFGEDGRYCKKCSGFLVNDEQAPARAALKGIE